MGSLVWKWRRDDAVAMTSDPHTAPDAVQFRILDAAFNRLLEALRVIEDQLRFGHCRKQIAAYWQQLRRDAGALRSLLEADAGEFSRYRDVEGDPLRGLPGSGPHRGSGQILSANIGRAREASRSVEETIRSTFPSSTSEAESLRYRIYQLESITIGTLQRSPALEDRLLYLLVTEELCHGNILETAAAAIDGGASIVQLREKTMEDEKLLALARQLRQITADRNALLIINDRVDIACLCQADGVHLGQQDLAPHEARRMLGPDALIGLSTHDSEQARSAEMAGADYIGVGPIFLTRTKRHREAVGTEYIQQSTEACGLPGFAIGHIDDETIDEVIEAGATRIAVCTGIIARPDPQLAARQLHDKLLRCRIREVADESSG